MAISVPGDKSIPLHERTKHWFFEKEGRRNSFFQKFQWECATYLAKGVIIVRWDAKDERPTHYERQYGGWGCFDCPYNCDENPQAYRSFDAAMAELGHLRGLFPCKKIGFALWIYPNYRKLYLPHYKLRYKRSLAS